MGREREENGGMEGRQMGMHENSPETLKCYQADDAEKIRKMQHMEHFRKLSWS